MIVVNFILVNKVSFTIILRILNIKLFRTMLLCGRLIFTTLHLSLFMSFRPGTGCFLRAHRVKNSRESSNRLTTTNRNFHIRSLKVQGTDPWINKVLDSFVSSFTEDHPLSSPPVVFRKSKEREIWCIMSAISANSHSTILYHGNSYRKEQRTNKISLKSFAIDKAHGSSRPLLCLFTVKPAPYSPESRFGEYIWYQSLTPKHIEIGLLSTTFTNTDVN